MKPKSGSFGVFMVDDGDRFAERFARALVQVPDLELLGRARDPYEAVKMLRGILPDVILLEVALPRMSGLTFLQRLMAQHPLPVVVCSKSGRRDAARALGAEAVLAKPRSEADWRALFHAIRGAVSKLDGAAPPPLEHEDLGRSKNSPDLLLPKFDLRKVHRGTTEPLLVIGASTGGTEALEAVLAEFPVDAPATAIVQHMPARFTGQFAHRLDAVCAVRVVEAQQGTPLVRGTVAIAPGHAHLVVRRAGSTYFCELRDGPPVSRHRPSVDVLLRSTAFAAGSNAVAAVLTGMGSDGALGLAELRRAGASTVAQDEKSSVVFGMPKEAIDAGGAEQVLPLAKIAGFLLENSRRRRARASS